MRLPRASRRTDAALAVALAALAVATRWPRRGQALFSWDSGLLASGLRSYDFAAGHPHPPFYPLAIAMGKALAPWTGEVGALVTLAVLASAVMAAFTYLAARLVLGVPAALLAAALVLLSPTALFNGVAPLTYALEGASSAVVGWAALRCRAQPTRGRAVGLAVATSVAIGIRPSSLFLVAPLAVWAVWGRTPERLRALWWGLGAGAAASLAWAVPALAAGGGLEEFLAGNRYQSRFVVFAHTAFQDGPSVLAVNAARLASYVPWELPFLAAVAALAAVGAFAWWPHRPRAEGPGSGSGPGASPLAWLAVWTLPSLAFFVALYAGWPVYPSGYVLVLVPPVAVAAALVLASLARGVLASGAPPAAQALAAVAMAATLLLPAWWPAAWDDATGGQREADAWSATLRSLRDAHPPGSTAIVTYYGWFWVRLELPEYLVWGAQPYWDGEGRVLVQVAEAQNGHEWPPAYANAMDGPDDPLHPIPAWVETVVVVYGPPTRGELQVFKAGVPVEREVLPSGLVVDTVAASDLPATIEQALVWFEDDGTPIPAPGESPDA